MADVKLVIDGTEVVGRTDMTILDAAESIGIAVPTLCHLRGLLPIGGCRMCVVEVEGAHRLVGACHTPLANGMVVKTKSTKVLRARKTIVELMLAGHTGPCVSDARIGQCELNRVASDLEAGPPRFQMRKVRSYPVEDKSAYITRDLSRCILCGRCVKACAEVVGANVFSTGYRGYGSKIVVDSDKVLVKDVCKDCGVCAEYCPTSALTVPGVPVQKKRDRTVAAAAVAPSIRYRHDRLLSMLKDAQKKFRHVPEEFIRQTAKSLNMTESEVYGVMSFYSFLSGKPQGRHVIRVCNNIPCQMKGSEGIVNGVKNALGIGPGETTPDGKFTLEVTNCIGACDTAPAMLVDDDVHGALTPRKIANILKEYA
jgi:NADH:ubiquinone oxidoreductase subunit E/Pyruvate/2-oxoacid:ferredoxin oxidoreductase delta subunit